MAPNKLPWPIMQTLITETYGGKIDDEGDFSQLRSIVERIFTPAAFDDDYKLVDTSDEPLFVPQGTKMVQFMDWVNRLPEREPPTYLGLPANAEKLLLVGHGKGMIKNLGMVIGMLEDGEKVMAEAA